jgi:hypothetical protein
MSAELVEIEIEEYNKLCKKLLKNYDMGIKKKYLNINSLSLDMANDLSVIIETNNINNKSKEKYILDAVSESELYKYFMPFLDFFLHDFNAIDQIVFNCTKKINTMLAKEIYNFLV